MPKHEQRTAPWDFALVVLMIPMLLEIWGILLTDVWWILNYSSLDFFSTGAVPQALRESVLSWELGAAAVLYVFLQIRGTYTFFRAVASQILILLARFPFGLLLHLVPLVLFDHYATRPLTAALMQPPQASAGAAAIYVPELAGPLRLALLFLLDGGFLWLVIQGWKGIRRNAGS